MSSFSENVFEEENDLNCGYFGTALFASVSCVSYLNDDATKTQIILTKATPVELALEGRPFSCKPAHIIANIGSPGVLLYHELLYLIKVTKCQGQFDQLQSLTLQLPLDYQENEIQERKFVDMVLNCLPPSWTYKKNAVYFGSNRQDIRMLCIFVKSGFNQSLSETNTQLITDAYKRPKRIMKLLTGGVHALSLKNTLELIATIGVQSNDACWELGCGEMNLAFALSAATNGGLVIATDLPSVLLEIVQIVEVYKRATRKRKECLNSENN